MVMNKIEDEIKMSELIKVYDYPFNKETPPKEIIISVAKIIAEKLEPLGFKYLKSQSKVQKLTKDFCFIFSIQSNRYNSKGAYAELIIHCTIADRKKEKIYWKKTLATSNSKTEQLKWLNFYGKDNYYENLSLVLGIIYKNLLPYFHRLEHMDEKLVDEIAEKGFSIFGEEQFYDSGYKIPIDFLLKHGTKNHLQKAFQNYIDNHSLDFVKPNFKKAVEQIKQGKEVVNNGEKDYALIAVQLGLELDFN